MYKIMSISLAFFLNTPFALAASCQAQATSLKAEYRIQTATLQGEQTLLLNLWRQQGQVAHEYPQTHITEAWEQVNEQLIKPTRFFDSHERAIEYQPGESVHGKTETNWPYRYQLFSNKLLASMQLDELSGEGCHKSQTLTLSKGNEKWTLVWLPELNIAKRFTVNTPSKTEEWTLTQLSFNQSAIEAFFAQRLTYQTTDFADIGDDHTDPFLTNMVHQGFIEHGASGFYNAQGKHIDTGHQH